MSVTLHSVSTAAFIKALTVMPDATPDMRQTLRERRAHWGISCEELAAVSGYSPATISFWEGCLKRGMTVRPNMRVWLMALGMAIRDIRTENRRKGNGRIHRRRRSEKVVNCAQELHAA